MRSLLSRDRVFIFVILIPLLFLITLLIYYPAVDTFQTSLTSRNLRINRPPEFVGLENYTRLLTDDEFWEVAGRSLLLVAMILPIELTIALSAALLLNEHFPGRGLVRTLVVLPWMVPPVVNGFLWGWLLNGEYGAFNGLLYQFGLISEYQYWLQNPQSQLLWVAVVQSWTRFAFPTIVLLAGLQGIPGDLYDAAKVDGANAWHRFRSVTIPMVSATTFFLLVIQMIGAFQLFAEPLVMTANTQGTIPQASQSIVIYIYQNAFSFQRMGKAAAIAWVLFGIIFVFTLLQTYLQRHWVHYETE